MGHVGRLELQASIAGRVSAGPGDDGVPVATGVELDAQEIADLKNSVDDAAEKAKKAKAAEVTNVTFDRNGYKYHGRVKALADAAREAGLKF